MNCDEVGWSEPSPEGAPAAESTFGVRLRERDPWVDLVREAGPFPPEGGAVEGERRESLMMQ